MPSDPRQDAVSIRGALLALSDVAEDAANAVEPLGHHFPALRYWIEKARDMLVTQPDPDTLTPDVASLDVAWAEAEIAADRFRDGSFRWTRQQHAPMVLRRSDADRWSAQAEGQRGIGRSGPEALRNLAAALTTPESSNAK